ncbi:dihydrodipicolinate synthase family protein [Portibacter lacus]|uniref:N-acetylneuraminate lyase n=1 Tax=Portibacter lacus TaxID=1099794 RepID=A0AA37WDF8_9BACT|nr:dihydrodipicolinate synthase family protein [Portibacter lacus]GLR15972.1 N-acetylneuraminate lyase [Portibacter lacus]
MKLIAAVYAPMQADQSLNLEIIDQYAPFLMTNGIKGVFVNGSTGDFVSLTDKERMELIEKWSDYSKEDFKIINHVGHNSLREARKLASHASKYVDGIAVLPPYYFKLKRIQDLVLYCKQIAEAAPNVPFYYYHIPALSGANFKMRDFVEIAVKEIPTFQGIKFTNNDFIDYQECVLYNDLLAEKYEMYFGIDEMLMNSLNLGGNGWVGSTYNHIAPLYQSIMEAFGNQEYKLAMEMQSKAIKFVNILDGYGGFNGAGKSYMRALGVDCGPTRFPHTSLADDNILEINKKLKSAGLTESNFSSK